MSEKTRASFPGTFWAANTIELFERAAYYSMASFVVIYLKEALGMTPTFATFLNGTLLWGLVYFLPILSGSLADRYGYKRSLTVAFVMLSLGYFVMGNLQRFWPGLIGARSSQAIDYSVPVMMGILLIGIGGSIVKPCIAGTIQKTAGKWATLGFGIFYMVINIGSISGRGVAYLVRRQFGIPSIFFPVASAFALTGLLVTLLVYREPEYAADGVKDSQIVKRKTLSEALLGIFLVLKSLKFVLFLVFIGLFWVLYLQLYNLFPLFLRFIDPGAPVELYTLANPIMIVTLQLAVTRLVKKWSPVRSIIAGIIVTTCGMLLNLIPVLFLKDLAQRTSLLGVTLPIAGLVMIGSIAAMALGEMMASPRIYEYLGSIAPKGEEGLYLGYANLPVAIGSIIGGTLGGILFETFINTPFKNGRPVNVLPIWPILAVIGLVSMTGLAIYNRVLLRAKGA